MQVNNRDFIIDAILLSLTVYLYLYYCRYYLPKICVQELVNIITKFIAVELKVTILEEYPSIDDIIGEDDNEILRNKLLKRQKLYLEAIDIIENFFKQK